MAHITKNGNLYSFQLRVPQDLIAHFEGKKMIKVPLKTADKRQAEVAAGRLLGQYQERFDALRRGEQFTAINASLEPYGVSIRPGEDIGSIIAAAAGNERSKADMIQRFGPVVLAICRMAEIHLDFDDIAKLMGSPAVAREAAATMERIAPGEPSAKSEPVQIDNNPMGLTALHPKFRAARPASLRTQVNDSDAISRFKALHGDLSIGDITEKHLRDYRDALTNNKQSGESLNKQTTQKLLSPIKAMLTWAADDGIIETNVGLAVRVHGVNQDVNKRRPFLPDHLKAIFCSGPFAPGKIERGSEFWMMLLGLFTGARLGEMVQLDAADISEIPINGSGKAWVMRVHAEGDNTVKTAESERIIPIHPQLVSLGFVAWAKSETGLLFPDMQTASRKTGQKSDVASKRLNRIIRSAGIADESRVVYSFRHNFEDACREAGHEKRLADALQGHKDDSMSGGYGHGFSTKKLVEAMSALHWPVDLSGLLP